MKPILAAFAAIVLTGGLSRAAILYQNVNLDDDPLYITQPVAGFLFGNPTNVSGDTMTNIDVNEVTMAPGSAGDQVTSLSFLIYNGNSAIPNLRLLLYVWAADGTSGNPGTLLGQFILAPPYINGPEQGLLTYNVTTPLIVPANGILWLGAGLDNDNGASTVTNTELENIGGLTFNPPSFGTDPLDASYISPGTPLTNPTLNDLATGYQGDFGWVVDGNQVAAPEPGTLGLMLFGVPIAAFVWARRKMRPLNFNCGS